MSENQRAQGDRMCLPEIIVREELCNQLIRNARLTQLLGEQTGLTTETRDAVYLQKAVTATELLGILDLINQTVQNPRRAHSVCHRFVVYRVFSHGKKLIRIDIMDPRAEEG